jgi:glucosamine-6-phosphate deaminase
MRQKPHPLSLKEIADLIKSKQQKKENCVLWLGNWFFPIMVYDELVRMHEEGLSFSNVITFNLMNTIPCGLDNNKSYHYFHAPTPLIILT